MDRIKQLLAVLANSESLTAEELTQARIDLAEAVDAFAVAVAEDNSLLTVAAREALAEADVVAAQVDELLVTREQEQADALATLEEIRGRIAPKAETPTEPEGEGEGESTDEGAEGDGEGDAASEPEAATEPEAVPIAAAIEPKPRTAVPLSVLNRFQTVETKPREQVEAEIKPKITAGPDQVNFFSGQELTFADAAQAMTDRLEADNRYEGPTMDARVGRISWRHQYSNDRSVSGLAQKPSEVEGKFAAVTGIVPGYDLSVLTPRGSGPSMTAAGGGLCAPVTVRYELEEVSVADRPLRDGLPSFNADRGGIQFNSPPHLVDILADTTSAALTTLTVANDASDTAKTVQSVACGTLNTVQVRAIADRLQFSNFGDRYNPERMRAFMSLALAAHSRLCERELLEDMRAASTVTFGGVVEVGAARQLIENLYVAAEGMRYRHRMADSYPIRVVLPMWVATVVEIDFLKQAPGDAVANNPVNGEAWITSQLGQENIRPIWQRDDARTNNSLGAGAPSFGAQTGGGASLNDFPGRCESIMFPEGSFLFLDGGQLDFGIVRDSTLNQANRFQTFFEVFEGVAFVGVESLDITTLVCASGGAAALVSTKCGGVGS